MWRMHGEGEGKRYVRKKNKASYAAGQEKKCWSGDAKKWMAMKYTLEIICMICWEIGF